MNNILVGCGQITWIRFTPNGAKWLVPEEQVLAEIAQAGYVGAPAGPDSGRSAEETIELFGRYGLRPAPGYVGTAFWEKERRDEILERVRRHAAFMREVGCTELYVAPGGFDYVTRSGQTRRETAGHVRPEDSLTDDQFEIFAETLNLAGEITLTEGVRSCFHNHVGTVIETREEVDRLLGLTDPALVFLGPDTGHLAWAGADPVSFCRDYAPRIKTLHLKDIDAAVRDRGREAGWDYGTFEQHGVFVELGEGCIDFPAIFAILHEVDFAGWVITETDVTQKPTAFESVAVSRAYLRSLGL
ncbi:MAG: sugar phosphate isomerase/epimerase [Chloroflexota bacterium]|nr:sugar phosphate isomerase/epimerase [Chloroflexota bacterium]